MFVFFSTGHLSQSLTASSGEKMGDDDIVLSIRMKSFPSPWYLTKGIVFVLDDIDKTVLLPTTAANEEAGLAVEV